MTKTNDFTVTREWAKRPDDQRFLSLNSLMESVKNRTINSKTATTTTSALKAYGTEEDEIVINTELGPKFFTNWSFGQMAGLVGAPATYLKKLNAPLAAACLNFGLENSPRAESMLLVNGNDTLRAITSAQYGRIWDEEVVNSVMNVVDGTTWQIPAASYATKDPKRATTLYASDRDIFIFLVDPEHPIEVPGETEPLFRGFYVWNSEVGSQTFGLAMFLYERVCDNRGIWGISHRSELRIKHSSGAPMRFVKEGKQHLVEYANESAAPIVERIKRAQSIQLGKDEDEVKEFLKRKGLTVSQANMAFQNTVENAKDPKNAWAMSQGITQMARSIPHTDTRVAVERIAGKILDTVTA